MKLCLAEYTNVRFTIHPATSVDMLLTNTKALFALVVTHAHAKALHATMFDKSLASLAIIVVNLSKEFSLWPAL